MTPSKLIAVAAATLALTACGSAQKMTSPAMQGKSTPTQSSDGVLIGPKGMTLYTFAKDTANSGTSACNGPCAANWPPLAVSDKAQALGLQRHAAVLLRQRQEARRQAG